MSTGSLCATGQTLDNGRDGGETGTQRVLQLHRKILAGAPVGMPREGRLLDSNGRRTND
jgi:hypothetical protein